MIAKIHTGNNFGGLVNYANDIVKKDAVVVASYGVSLTSNAAITASFKAQAKARSGVKNFVGHISLSFSPNDKEKVNNDLMAQIAREYMRRMGIVNTQFVVFRHQDQPHPHVHIIYNRVNNDGDAIMGDCNFRKSAAITKALTREYGLTFGKGKKNVRRERLKGKDVIKYRIYDEVNASLKSCSSWQDLRFVQGTLAQGHFAGFCPRQQWQRSRSDLHRQRKQRHLCRWKDRPFAELRQYQSILGDCQCHRCSRSRNAVAAAYRTII